VSDCILEEVPSERFWLYLHEYVPVEEDDTKQTSKDAPTQKLVFLTYFRKQKNYKFSKGDQEIPWIRLRMKYDWLTGNI
jgi:hypothetical protein